MNPVFACLRNEARHDGGRRGPAGLYQVMLLVPPQVRLRLVAREVHSWRAV
jgi:hypothetical protein